MKPTLVVKAQADADLDELGEFIALDSPQAALRFYEAAQTAYDTLVRFPKIGARCEFRSPQAADLRMWPIPGFENRIIFYRSNKNSIEIVRILHGARDLQSIFEK